MNRAYATAARLKVGSPVRLSGPGGAHTAHVAGILRTVTGFNGLGMQMSLDSLRSIYGATIDNEVLVKAHSDAERAALSRRIDAFLARRHPSLESLSTADVKDQIEGEVNQQFNLFNAIIAIAVIVSLLGVVNTLAMSVMERTREIGVLRALGSSRWLVRSMIMVESLLTTLAGAIAGIAFGAAIAFVWITGLDALVPGTRPVRRRARRPLSFQTRAL